jgi:hypothetical protein
MLSASAIRSPTEELKQTHPIFYHRIHFAYITHQFCSLFQHGTLDPTKLADRVDQLYSDIYLWRNNLPSDYVPEASMTTTPNEYPYVLLMHLEYYGLLSAMFSGLVTVSRLLPRETNVKRHPSIRIRNQASICLGNARSVLQTLCSIVGMSGTDQSVTCW